MNWDFQRACFSDGMVIWLTVEEENGMVRSRVTVTVITDLSFCGLAVTMPFLDYNG